MASGRALALRFVNFDVERTSSYADVVRRIGALLGLRVASLPSTLESSETASHGQCFGMATLELDLIAEAHCLDWSIRDGALYMEPDRDAAKVKAAKQLNSFYQVAGKLMAETKRKGTRAAKGEYERVAGELDSQGIRPLGNLELATNDKLRLYIQKHSKDGFDYDTWTSALKNTWIGHLDKRTIKDGTVKTLIRARQAYLKARP